MSRLVGSGGAIIIVLGFSIAALAQGGDGSACQLLTKERAAAFAIARKGSACQVECKGCGCKGGPGYRNAKGRCVGYKNLIRECGPPPHLRCAAECTPVAAGCDGPPTLGGEGPTNSSGGKSIP